MPRSTFYYRAQKHAETLSDEKIVQLIREIQSELPGYGYRRVTHELRRRGYPINHKRVARVMRMHCLGVKPRRHFMRMTNSNHDQPAFPNLYRNVIPAKPDTVWVGDITYIRLAYGFCYLAVILDACSRKVVGYAISHQIDTQLVLAALDAAVLSRKPAPGLIFHSDRGTQYSSEKYRHALAQFGLQGSMSSPGNPYQNAQAESFMKTVKVEEVYAAGYQSIQDVAAQLPRFIEDIYNARRLHSALGYLPPDEFEANLTRLAA